MYMNDQPHNATRLGVAFLGGTDTVTGSRYVVEAGGARVMVDCGLFQGYKTLRLRNWLPFPVDPASIDAVVLTHAHLDHSGYLPRLIRQGFHGPVWCTPATRDLCGILLPDAAHLLEEEARHANQRGSSKHHPAEPLYTVGDAQRCLDLMRVVDFSDAFDPVPGITATFHTQGHILGAASVSLVHRGRRITFSGDVGRSNDAVMRAPSSLPASDWVVVESTYGNRHHPTALLTDLLVEPIRRTLGRGGVVMIPAFAVGRAQLLLHVIATLQAEGRIPRAPIYLNSPMAKDVTLLYGKYRSEHLLDDAALERLHAATRFVNSIEESKSLNLRQGPMIIVAGSGMLTGGRILHHLIAFGPDCRNMILLPGFQAGGTRGAALVRGDKLLRIYGQDVPIRAEVVQVEAASAHADADELLSWLRTAQTTPRQVFITHGEPDAADALRLAIERQLHWSACIPEYLQHIDLDPG